MRFYRLSMSTVLDGHSGYAFFASLKEASAAAAEFRRNMKDADTPIDCEVEPITIEPTKAGILAALRRFASHNDNG